ncbi:MAG: hypothetical protein KIT27_07465 [Legionellales bacterium]|nr:hypothetical protein [Legionellales bacterium]
MFAININFSGWKIYTILQSITSLSLNNTLYVKNLFAVLCLKATDKNIFLELNNYITNTLGFNVLGAISDSSYPITLSFNATLISLAKTCHGTILKLLGNTTTLLPGTQAAINNAAVAVDAHDCEISWLFESLISGGVFGVVILLVILLRSYRKESNVSENEGLASGEQFAHHNEVAIDPPNPYRSDSESEKEGDNHPVQESFQNEGPTSP